MAPPPAIRPAVQAVRGPGTWTSLSIEVADVGVHHRQVRVYTPDVARPDLLPVVYALHGLPGSDRDLCNAGSVRGLESAFRTGVEPFVLACPDARTTAVTDAEWADTTDGSTHLETFVTRQIIDAVEGRNRRPRGMRALAGFSMGGFAAASLALRHPALYSQVIALAGYFRIDDPDRIFGTDPAAHDPDDLVPTAGRLRWFLVQARRDRSSLTARDSDRWAAVLHHHRVRATVTTTAGGHNPAWADAQLPAAAVFLAAGWRT